LSSTSRRAPAPLPATVAARSLSADSPPASSARLNGAAWSFARYGEPDESQQQRRTGMSGHQRAPVVAHGGDADGVDQVGDGFGHG